MIKFLDRFGLDRKDVRQVFPDYSKLFDDLDRLGEKVKQDASKQAENEYINILESVDDFLMREESLQKFRETLDLPMVVESGGTDFTQEEAIEYLEDEIYELEKNIPEEILAKQKERETVYKPKSEVKVDLSKRVERFDDRGGVKFKYIQFKKEPFDKCLSMMNSGCKFSYTSFGDRNYILFHLNNEVKLIVETSTPVKQYNSIFGGSSDVMAYILCKNQKDVPKYYELLRYAFDEIESEPYSKIDDDSLYNNPPLIGAFIEGYLYEPADEIIQQGIINSRDIESLFSLYLPLNQILILQLCSSIHANRSSITNDYINLTQEEIQENIVERVSNYSLYFEGIGEIPHTVDVLEDLRDKNYLTESYQPTRKGFELIELNKTVLTPSFRPTMYYVADIKQQFKKSQKKFSSMFGNDVVYHIKDNYTKIDIAIVLTPKQVIDWGMEKATQINAFTQQYQEDLDVYDYEEFLPFGSESELNVNLRVTEAEKRKIENQINFQDRDRNKMYVASSTAPVFSWCVNVFNYNFLKKLYPNKTLKILAPNIPSYSLNQQIFLKVVDEKNNLIGLLSPDSKQIKTPQIDKKYRQEYIDWRNEKINSGVWDVTESEFVKEKNIPVQYRIDEDYKELRTPPLPPWSFDKLLNTIETKYPDFSKNGISVDNVGDLTPYSETDDKGVKENKEESTIPSVISPQGDYQEESDEQSKEPIVKNQEEISNIQEDIDALREIAGDDEDILNEIKELENQKQNLIDG